MRGASTSIAVLLGAFLIIGSAGNEQLPQNDFENDFSYAVARVAQEYAYFDVKATHWNDIPKLYAPDLKAVHDKRAFVTLLEQVIDELYDPHAQLTVNTSQSMRRDSGGCGHYVDQWCRDNRCGRGTSRTFISAFCRRCS